MPKHRLTDADAIEAGIRIARAQQAVGSLTLSIWANCFIGLTTVAILWSQNPARSLVVWFCGLVVLNMMRLLMWRSIHSRDLPRIDPELTLRILAAAAGLVGCIWAVAPFLETTLLGAAAHAYIIFIIGGLCCGAIVQSPASSNIAIAFCTPPMLSAIASLLWTGTTVNIIVALDVALLMAMMVRSSRRSQAAFVESHRARLAAMSLADSLSTANTEIRKSNEQLEILASHDPLTGLGNRTAFNRGLTQILQQNGDAGWPVALLVIDLDRFKLINDTMGHSAGDIVLTTFASRLSMLKDPSDLAVRLGGDEFAVVVQGPLAEERAQALALKILDAGAQTVPIQGRSVTSGASVGLAVFPEHGITQEDIFASADIALYAAKEQGRRCVCIFNPEIKRQLDRQRLIEMALENAIAAGEIRVLFQPQVNLLDGSVIGFEALIRWNHPEVGPIPPPEIVRAAKALHVSDKLTLHVATAAADLARQLPDLGMHGVPVAINVSPCEFSAYLLSQNLLEVVTAAGIQPSQIEIEITEEAILDTVTAGTELARLEQAGFRLAVDDFGMGHSSLAYIVGLRIDRLKIDRSFITGIAASRENQALVAALVGMGRALAIDIVVEGVETAEDAEVLRMLGCRFAQGYLYAMPMPPEVLLAWITGQRQPDQPPVSLA
ncbi:EAL domain-containing protein [Neorhizobium sp. T786]|uniref:putative bifunctional diguanylate cyclase/phosphodiesterase n=1 Tax=Pseudorhizobium xiangyangii TaxID=2883104 RepID=UPI001D0001BF|nr:EAL domain-containing protein [Neorhizobium xiangyangii]MCB5200947.1 EAL domain-containing protein [Neorhizobium xiangyangii]